MNKYEGKASDEGNTEKISQKSLHEQLIPSQRDQGYHVSGERIAVG